MQKAFVWRKVGVVAAVAGVVFLGNSRVETSEAATPHDFPPVVDAAVARSAESQVAQRDPATLLQQIGADVDSAAEKSETPDDARLVPAIFAWDPDVRFVYYRQVSKWM